MVTKLFERFFIFKTLQFAKKHEKACFLTWPFWRESYIYFFPPELRDFWPYFHPRDANFIEVTQKPPPDHFLCICYFVRAWLNVFSSIFGVFEIFTPPNHLCEVRTILRNHQFYHIFWKSWFFSCILDFRGVNRARPP